MPFRHEQRDDYRVSVRDVALAHEAAKRSRGIDRHARNELLRGSPSLPLSSAQGNGQEPTPIGALFSGSRVSTLDLGSIQNGPEGCKRLTADENVQRETMLIRVVSMFAGLAQRSWEVRENRGFYDSLDNDNDNDNDNSAERTR
jgi:hypothetical protein